MLSRSRAGLGISALIACLALAGCDTNRPPLSTSPVGKSDIEVTVDPNTTEDSPQEIESTGGDFAGSTTLGGPIAGLGGADLARFNAGLAEFVDVESVEDGLGPVFNEASCASCHTGPTGGTNGRVETRFGRWRRSGFDPLASLGGSLIQDHAIGQVTTPKGTYVYVPEVVPRIANVRAGRVTTPLFGLGLVDAVPDGVLLELAQREARQSPSTRGTPHMVTEIATGATRVGRFGWKAQVPTLHQFSGDAYLNEMGVTNPEFPTESSPQGNQAALGYNPAPAMNDAGDGVGKFTDFMTLLGPPPRGPRTILTDNGGRVFRSIGCANCHTPTLTTGDHPVPALSHKTFQPFSDFLLHDMGSLGDGIVQGRSTGRQMRTAPLWGLMSRPSYMHDGRARTPQSAIVAHDGQGADARDRYLRLSSSDRFALLSFLRSL